MESSNPAQIIDVSLSEASPGSARVRAEYGMTSSNSHACWRYAIGLLWPYLGLVIASPMDPHPGDDQRPPAFHSRRPRASQPPDRRVEPARAALIRPDQVYRAHCLECHDSDGRGESAREVMPKVPDFTDPTWQDSRNDRELNHS